MRTRCNNYIEDIGNLLRSFDIIGFKRVNPKADVALIVLKGLLHK